MTLAEFLLERLDDVEGAITYHTTFGAASYEGHQCFDFQTPEFIRAECEAKRRIVALHHHPGNYCPQCVNIDDGEVVFHIGGCPTLRLLALPFADHPDYDESWRP